MAEATEKQLRERWLTFEGKKFRQQIIKHIREDDWQKLLISFSFVEEVENGRNIRFINLNKADLRGANLIGANLSKAHLWEAHLWGADLRGANLTGRRWQDFIKDQNRTKYQRYLLLPKKPGQKR